jgi:DNA-binding NarL/FixJ family response regulator
MHGQKPKISQRSLRLAHFVTRVLVVEDHEPFRRFISSVLRGSAGLQVIGEVADGLEAVARAEKLQPDLVLLDIGLPGLNGIEAARRIRRVAARSKILFVSLESSPSVVQTALNLGALGYVLKSEAGTDLLTAVEAAIRGQQFVSSRLSDLVSLPQTPGAFGFREAPPSRAPAGVVRHHPVHFYSDDETFLTDFTGFITSALNAQSSVIVVTTESHRTSLIERLQGDGVNIAAAVDQKRYIALDVADPLSPMMVNNSSDPDRFAQCARDLIVEAAREASEANLPLVVG